MPECFVVQVQSDADGPMEQTAEAGAVAIAVGVAEGEAGHW